MRQKGFEDVVKAAPGVTMAGVVDGRNIQDNAMSAAENLMTANPDLTAIYATGEPALLGAVAAVESQGRQGDVKIVGWDLTASAIKGIDAGYVVGVVQQDPAGMGAAAVEALVKAIASKPAVDRDHRRADHDRHQGQRRALPRRVQVMAAMRTGRPAAAPTPARSGSTRHQEALRLDRGAARRRSRPVPGRGAWGWSATMPPASRR